MRERARVTYNRCISYERQLIIMHTLIFFGFVADWRGSVVVRERDYHTGERAGFDSGL